MACNCRRKSLILFSTSRRSSSNWVSPGPRRPTPFFCRERCVHIRFSRGIEYSNCASSTASRAWAVCARLAKMSRISSVRSSTFRPIASSRLRVCPGLRSLSKTTRSASLAAASVLSSSTLPLPRYVVASGASRRWVNRPTTRTPAVSASPSSSSSGAPALPDPAGTRRPGRPPR